MEENGNKITNFVAQHWVSWIIEIVILSIIAYFTIAETRKTAEQTREMIGRFEASISKYASEKTEALDSAAAESYESLKAKTKELDLNVEGVKGLLGKFKKEQSDVPK